MATKVFGIGLHKTGTTSLREALRILGYEVCPENLAYSNRIHTISKEYLPCLKLANEYDAFDDSPWNYRGFYRVLDYVFPNAKFVLTVRDKDAWFTSLLRWVESHDSASGICMIATLGISAEHQRRQEAQGAYQKHNEEVETYFGDRKEKLLVANWEAGTSWKELCDFLQKPIPDLVFPHMLKYEPATDTYSNYYNAVDAALNAKPKIRGRHK